MSYTMRFHRAGIETDFDDAASYRDLKFDSEDIFFECVPFWIAFSHLKADTSRVFPSEPMISVSEDKKSARILHQTGKKAFSLEFNNIRLPDPDPE